MTLEDTNGGMLSFDWLLVIGFLYFFFKPFIRPLFKEAFSYRPQLTPLLLRVRFLETHCLQWLQSIYQCRGTGGMCRPLTMQQKVDMAERFGRARY